MNVHSQPLSVLFQGGSRKGEILRAALELFSERGFHGASIPALAERAGIAAGSLYRHFPSKEALVNELYRALKADLLDALLRDFPSGLCPREQFRAIFFRLSDYARRDPHAFSFLEFHHHADYLDEESRRLERRSFAPFIGFFEEARAAKLTKSLPPAALLGIVWGSFSGLLKAHILGHIGLTDEILAQAEACAWDAIVAHPG